MQTKIWHSCDWYASISVLPLSWVDVRKQDSGIGHYTMAYSAPILALGHAVFKCAARFVCALTELVVATISSSLFLDNRQAAEIRRTVDRAEETQ